MKNKILLLLGVIVTAVVLIVPDHLFEALYFDNEFSNEMYNSHLYLDTALIAAATAWVLAAAYYYLINSVSFSRWYHWLIVLAVAAVVCPTAVYLHVTSVMEEMQLDFSLQAFRFALTVALVEVVLFVAASFAIRWWSTNCRHTPFPE